MPSRVRRPATPVRPPQPGEMDETRPHLDTEVAGLAGLEPASPALYQLKYACLLVPRLKAHYLTGDVASELSDCSRIICIAFGWRLEFLAVRPEYLQWVVSVPPNTSPGHLMRVMRQQTSEKIIQRVPAHEKGKSLRRFLGARISHHGRHPAAPAAIGQGIHQADARPAGKFPIAQVDESRSTCACRRARGPGSPCSAFLFHSSTGLKHKIPPLRMGQK